MFPRSEHHAHTRPARGRTASAGGDARGGRHQWGKHPTPAARTHGRKPKHDPERPQRSKVHGARKAWTQGAPGPRAAGAALEARHRQGGATGAFASDSKPVGRPGGPSGAPLARGPHPKAARISVPSRSQPRQPQPGAQDGLPPRAPAAVPLSGPRGLHPRADSAPQGSPDLRLRVARGAPPRLPAPRR